MSLLAPLGALADHHPVAVFRAGLALAVFGVAFVVCTPLWARFKGRRS